MSDINWENTSLYGEKIQSGFLILKTATITVPRGKYYLYGCGGGRQGEDGQINGSTSNNKNSYVGAPGDSSTPEETYLGLDNDTKVTFGIGNSNQDSYINIGSTRYYTFKAASGSWIGRIYLEATTHTDYGDDGVINNQYSTYRLSDGRLDISVGEWISATGSAGPNHYFNGGGISGGLGLISGIGSYWGGVIGIGGYGGAGSRFKFMPTVEFTKAEDAKTPPTQTRTTEYGGTSTFTCYNGNPGEGLGAGGGSGCMFGFGNGSRGKGSAGAQGAIYIFKLS